MQTAAIAESEEMCIGRDKGPDRSSPSAVRGRI